MKKLLTLLSIIHYSLFIIPGLVFAVYIYAPGETAISSQGGYTLQKAQDESAFFETPAQDESAFFQSGPAQNYTAGCGPQGNGYKLCIPILGVDYIENSLAEYIRIIYRFALGLSGLLVFIMIVWGGIQYTISAGNTTATSDARDRIFQAILGMGLLFLSYIILNTINPDLISLREPNVDSVFLPNIAPTKNQQLDAEYNRLRSNKLNRMDQDIAEGKQKLETIREQIDNETDPEKLAELQQQELTVNEELLEDKIEKSASLNNDVVSRIQELETKQRGWANRSWYNPAKWGSGVGNVMYKPWLNWWYGGSPEAVGLDGLTQTEENELVSLRAQRDASQINSQPLRQDLRNVRQQ